MILSDILFILLSLYLLVYCIYQLFFLIKANNIDDYVEKQEKNRNSVKILKKICVIIYATQKDKNLESLLASLNNQVYDKNYYEVHTVYQRDENDTTFTKDFMNGARIHNIQNPDYFTKDKSLNLFIQKMLPENKYDVYVFLGAERIVGEKYLENINKSIVSSGILVGSKIVVNTKDIFIRKVKYQIISAYLKYANRTSNLVRSMFELPFVVDGGNFVVTADVLEKTGYVATEDRDAELEYTLDMAYNNIKLTFSPYIITGVDIKDYSFESAAIKNKISLFMHYFTFLMFKNNAFKEMCLFLLKPNSLAVVVSFLLLLFSIIYYPNIVTTVIFTFLGIFLFVNFVISIIISNMSFKEIAWLALYPVCLFLEKTKIYFNKITENSISKGEYEEENINSATINANAFNSKEDISCKLDLVQEDGMRKIIYREGNRFITTDSYLRMYDAMNDMIHKLKTKRLTLKVCQNCEHFSTSPDGSLDCVVGNCKISQRKICIWNGCQYFYNHNSKDNE